MTWDHRQFGTLADPVRQSALANIASQHGCPKRYSYERRAEGERPAHVAWKPALGTAIHETLRRALRTEPFDEGDVAPWPKIAAMWDGMSGDRRAAVKVAHPALVARMREVIREELERAADGRELRWYDDDPEVEIEAAVAMVLGATRIVAEVASEVVAVEVPFLVRLGDYYSSGTLDLLYRDLAGALALIDWKSGANRPDEVSLRHGYQPAIYGEAVARGVTWPGRRWESPEDAAHMRQRFATIEAGDALDETERRWDAWPARIDVVHLRDLVPYRRAPAKKTGKTIEDQRGPALYPSSRLPGDVVRLHVSLSTIVGTVRLGRFPERIGEQCRRCAHREACLGEAPALSTDATRRILSAGLDDDGLGELDS